MTLFSIRPLLSKARARARAHAHCKPRSAVPVRVVLIPILSQSTSPSPLPATKTGKKKTKAHICKLCDGRSQVPTQATLPRRDQTQLGNALTPRSRKRTIKSNAIYSNMRPCVRGFAVLPSPIPCFTLLCHADYLALLCLSTLHVSCRLAKTLR
jgi:hypothetical protein